MKDELLIKLKEAGFLQIGKGEFKYHYYRSGENLAEPPEVYVPTLDELIEDCPDHCGLQKDDFGWVMYVKGMIDTDTISKTPKEAVAKLWLKVNKK